jgi:hypothetical protein
MAVDEFTSAYDRIRDMGFLLYTVPYIQYSTEQRIEKKPITESPRQRKILKSFAMSNVHGLFSNKKDDDDDSHDERDNRFVGGIGAQGGGR